MLFLRVFSFISDGDPLIASGFIDPEVAIEPGSFQLSFTGTRNGLPDDPLGLLLGDCFGKKG